MNIEVITEKLELNLFGFSGVAVNRDYAATAFRLSGQMWQTLKENKIKNKGKNIWVYESDHKVFTGVEPEDISGNSADLERRNIVLPKYGYYKHIGSYNLLKDIGAMMTNELRSRGFETGLPYIEIYGHWTNDESTTETELFMSLK